MRSDAEFELALRQQRLLLRSEALRSAVAVQAQVLETPLAVADLARATVQWLYEHRLWLAGATVAVLIVRPRRAWRVARWSWWFWRSARRAQAWLAMAGMAGGRRA